MIEVLIDYLEAPFKYENFNVFVPLQQCNILHADTTLNTQQINVLSGTVFYPILNALIDTELSEENSLAILALGHLLELYNQKEYVAAYYYLLLLHSSLELEPPQAFCLLILDRNVLNTFLTEMIEDLNDCLPDLTTE